MSGHKPSWGEWGRRVGWLALLWTASVAVLAIVALAFRVLMNIAGMTV